MFYQDRVQQMTSRGPRPHALSEYLALGFHTKPLMRMGKFPNSIKAQLRLHYLLCCLIPSLLINFVYTELLFKPISVEKRLYPIELQCKKIRDYLFRYSYWPNGLQTCRRFKQSPYFVWSREPGLKRQYTKAINLFSNIPNPRI